MQTRRIKEIGKTPSGFKAEIIRELDGLVKVRSEKRNHLYVPSADRSEYAHIVNGRLIAWVKELPYFDDQGWLTF